MTTTWSRAWEMKLEQPIIQSHNEVIPYNVTIDILCPNKTKQIHKKYTKILGGVMSF